MKDKFPEFWSFNRFRDSSLITTENILWDGPFSWNGFENINKMNPIPDISGVYLFTFEYKDGYILRSAGITKSMKKRFCQHTREYKSGNYTVLDVDSAKRGERREIWHGWEYAKKHKDEFLIHKDYILKSLEKELCAYRLFISIVPDKRKQERIEFSIIHNAYMSKKEWSDLVDGGMALRGRSTSEIPINIKNNCSSKIYGLPEIMEI